MPANRITTQAAVNLIEAVGLPPEPDLLLAVVGMKSTQAARRLLLREQRTSGVAQQQAEAKRGRRVERRMASLRGS